MIKSLRDARQQYYGIINHNYALLLIYSRALKCEYFSYKNALKIGSDEHEENDESIIMKGGGQIYVE